MKKKETPADEALRMAQGGHRLVRLIDDRVVDNYSVEYMEQCLAQHLLKMPIKKRRIMLADFVDSWGFAKVDRIKEFMILLHRAKN